MTSKTFTVPVRIELSARSPQEAQQKIAELLRAALTSDGLEAPRATVGLPGKALDEAKAPAWVRVVA